MDDGGRFWSDIATRLLEGPFHFRFFLQPAMAALQALKDGAADARRGDPPFFWAQVSHPGDAWRMIRGGLGSVRRVIALGVVMDALYQLIVFRWIYPIELVVIVLLLAFVPYAALRGPVNRIWRRVHRKQ